MTSDTTFDRLRNANPVAAEPTGDTGDLFARITAEPGDARLAAPKPRRWRRRRTIGLAVAFAAIALGSSAFATVHYVFGGAVPPKVTQSEYRQAQRVLPLPPGYHWPRLLTPSNSVTTRGGGGGHAVVIAQTAWECYWAQAIRERDAAAATRAHTELNDLLAHNVVVAPNGAPEDWTPPNAGHGPLAVYADDGGYQFKQRIYGQAAAGRPAELTQSCRANAPQGWH